jgi:hypothetical protein
MNGPSSSEAAPASGQLRELYEAMRQRWLGADEAALAGSRGLAVLLRQGVAAWGTAWSLPLTRAEGASTGTAPAAVGAVAGSGLPLGSGRAELATVLATMVWTAAQGEAR